MSKKRLSYASIRLVALLVLLALIAEAASTGQFPIWVYGLVGVTTGSIIIAAG